MLFSPSNINVVTNDRFPKGDKTVYPEECDRHFIGTYAKLPPLKYAIVMFFMPDTTE